MNKKTKAITNSEAFYCTMLFFLIAGLVATILIAVSLGPVNISIGDTYRIIIGRLSGKHGLYADAGKATIAIVWNMRFPRVLLGIISGAGLAICGCVMQATVNNPISEPYILGVSSGATFGATLLIVMGLGTIVSGGAFIGAVIATVMVLGIADRKSVV